MIHVVNYKFNLPEEAVAIETTSRSTNWSQGLSPFYLGPCELYDGYVSKNMENGWQYSKVYQDHLDYDGKVSGRYFQWAQGGWSNYRAVRYPMPKGEVPLFSYWQGERLGYVEARKKIYIPLYSKAVAKTEAFKKLKDIHKSNENIYLIDFDAHSLTPGTYDYWDLWNNDKIKVGHAYVLAMMLENII